MLRPIVATTLLVAMVVSLLGCKAEEAPKKPAAPKAPAKSSNTTD